MKKPFLINAKKIMLWCDICNTKVWLRAKTIDDIWLEAMWHKRGLCLKKNRPIIIDEGTNPKRGLRLFKEILKYEQEVKPNSSHD